MPDIETESENPYFGVRRLGPYLGVIQIVDVGDACAYSTNGRSWRIRQQTSSGRFRWGSIIVKEGTMDRVSIVNGDHLVEALEKKPKTPFMIRDQFECWLLNKSTGKPLALLKTCYRKEDIHDVSDPHWYPFSHSSTGFESETLKSQAETNSDKRYRSPHSDVIEHLVNDLARPMAVAQWVQRKCDGSGLGLGGLRVDKSREGYEFTPEDFPELLITEDWDNEISAGLTNDYHNWQSPWLLAHQNLHLATRKRLEKAAFNHPAGLLSSYPLIPEVLDKDAMEVALISAKIMSAAQGTD